MDFNRDAFTLVEVALSLAIAAFAIVSLIGLLAVGLDQSRRSIDRSVESQIVDWSRGHAKIAYEGKDLDSLSASNPYYFDAEGIASNSLDVSNRIFSATINPVSKELPGSAQSIWGVEVKIESPARGNKFIATHAFWFRK